MLERKARIDLPDLLQAALAQVAGVRAANRTSARPCWRSATFVRTRMEGWFVDSLGCDPELVRAVLPVRWSDPVDALAWIGALDGYRERQDFQQLATGFKRCRNILKGDVLAPQDLEACRERWRAGGRGAGGEDLAGLGEPAEQALLAQVAGAAGDLLGAGNGGEYTTVFDILSSLGPSIDAFFDQVRVNADDPDLRRRRLAFLREVHGIFASYADFAAIGTRRGLIRRLPCRDREGGGLQAAPFRLFLQNPIDARHQFR